MGFVSVFEARGASARRGSYDVRRVFCCTDKAGVNKAGHTKYALRITLPRCVFNEARLMETDRMDIAFDNENNLCRISVQKTGYTMTNVSGKGERYVMKITHIENFMPVFESGPREIHSIQNGEIIFYTKDNFNLNFLAEGEA